MAGPLPVAGDYVIRTVEEYFGNHVNGVMLVRYVDRDTTIWGKITMKVGCSSLRDGRAEDAVVEFPPIVLRKLSLLEVLALESTS